MAALLFSFSALDRICSTISHGPKIMTAKTIHQLMFSRHLLSRKVHTVFMLCQQHSTFSFDVIFDRPFSWSSFRYARKRARARRTGLPCTCAGQWGRCLACARTHSSRRRWLPALLQAGPPYMAQRTARHLLGNFAILCIEALERTQASVLQRYFQGSDWNNFVNLYQQALV